LSSIKCICILSSSEECLSFTTFASFTGFTSFSSATSTTGSCGALLVDGIDYIVLFNVVTEDQRGDGRELDEDVDGWTRGILEWISDGVTNNGGNVQVSESALSLYPVVFLLEVWVIWYGITEMSEFLPGSVQVNISILNFLSES